MRIRRGNLLTKPGADAAYSPIAATKWTDLPANHMYAHHLGGLGESAWDQSITSGRISAAAGVPVLDLDLRNNAAGVPFVVHDTTFDLVTAYTGLRIDKMSTAAAKGMLYDPTKLTLSPGFPAEAIVSFADLLNELGGKYCLSVEGKTTATLTAALTEAARRKLYASVMFNTPNLSEIPTIKAAGFLCYYYWTDVDPTAYLTAAIAAAPNGIIIPGTTSNANITTVLNACNAAGIPLVVGDMNRRWRRDEVRALGVGALASDYPIYAQANAPLSTQLTEAVALGISPPGTILSALTPGGTPNQPLLVKGSGYQFPGSQGGLLLGSFGGADGFPTTYTYTVKMQWLTAAGAPGTTSRNLQFRFCGLDDTDVYGGSTPSVTNDYALNMQYDGQFKLFKAVKGQAAVQIGSTISSTAMVLGTDYLFTVTVTPTTITVTRVDTGATTGAIADATHRGSYLNATRGLSGGTPVLRDLVRT